jgi:hypothetical protein
MDNSLDFSLSQTANDIQLNTDSSSHVVSENKTVEIKKLPEDKVCTECLEENLIREGIADELRTCSKCGELYCIHSASKLDPQYCIFCCNDFVVQDTEESYVRETRNESGAVTSRKTYKVRHLSLSGQHWLFNNRAITNLSDLELDLAIEYHRGICNGMLQERETRRTSHLHRNKNKRAGNEEHSLLEGSAAQPIIFTQGGAVVSLSQTSTKRTRSTKVKQAEVELIPGVPNSAVKILLAKGMSLDDIKAMLKEHF